MRILVIEDEKKTAAFLAKGLREAGFAVDLALDGEMLGPEVNLDIAERVGCLVEAKARAESYRAVDGSRSRTHLHPGSTNLFAALTDVQDSLFLFDHI